MGQCEDKAKHDREFKQPRTTGLRALVYSSTPESSDELSVGKHLMTLKPK